MEFARWSGWRTVVVGDRKTPSNWTCEGVTYLDIDKQAELYPEFAALLPENTYIRKMLGYLFAIDNGAEYIFETDDDNIPYPDAATQIESDISTPTVARDSVASVGRWVNIYSLFQSQNCWPRGFPIQMLNDETTNPVVRENPDDTWGVLQYLADEDPDVDAIYRMVVSDPVYFRREYKVSLENGTYSPFNSQATLWKKEFFPMMFLPLGVTDRVADILRGYMTLSALWARESTLCYSSPIVYQERNAHNLLNDFKLEGGLYENADRWAEILRKSNGSDVVEVFKSAVQLLVDDGSLPECNLEAYDIFSKSVAG